MPTLRLCLMSLVALCVVPQGAYADWDDQAPTWTDSSNQQVVKPQAPSRPVETDEQWSQRRHTPQEVVARAKMQQQQLFARQMAEIRASRMPKPKLQFNPNVLLPGQSAYKEQNAFSTAEKDSGFFNGLTPQQAHDALSKRPYIPNSDNSPAWAKQKIQTRQFTDGVEHFGNEDRMGFF